MSVTYTYTFYYSSVNYIGNENLNAMSNFEQWQHVHAKHTHNIIVSLCIEIISSLVFNSHLDYAVVFVVNDIVAPPFAFSWWKKTTVRNWMCLKSVCVCVCHTFIFPLYVPNDCHRSGRWFCLYRDTQHLLCIIINDAVTQFVCYIL